MKLTYANGVIDISDDLIREFSTKEDLGEWGKINHPDIPNSLFSDAFDTVSSPKVKKEKKGEQ